MFPISSYFKNITIKDFELRDVQIEMATEIDKALENSEHRIIEAETGVGKTLGYLLPIALHLNHSKRKAVVITYSKALQNQILNKDLPFLKKILKNEFNINYVSMMGSNNYLCLYRQSRFENELFNDFDSSELDDWKNQTEDGLLFEIQIPATIVSQINRDSDTCLRKQCPYYNECFYYKAKNKARNADLIVANHSLFFANVQAEFNIFPKGDYLVIDEAHQIEEAASTYLSVELSLYKILRFLEDIYKTKYSFFKSYGIKAKELISFIHSLENALTSFYNHIFSVYKVEDKLRLKAKPDIEKIDFLSLFSDLAKEIGKISGDESEEFSARQDNIVAKLNNLEKDFKLFLSHSKSEDVYFIQKTKKDLILKVVPLHIAEIFETRILKEYKSVIFTSATLTVKGEFDFFKSIVCHDSQIKALRFHSIFDFKKQSRLYIPEHDFTHIDDKKLSQEILELVNISEGSAFVLFTNYKQMNRIYNILKQKINYPLFLQKGKNSSYILEQFKQKKNSVLFGNITFWQGVDMPGAHLRNVIITHLPFKVPSDPVIEARAEYYEKLTNNSFVHYYLPLTAITLKQGLGRLIRTHQDYGIVSILDTRIRTKFYGKILLKSLPNIPITTNKKELEIFFQQFS